jgi:hypothetical protein
VQVAGLFEVLFLVVLPVLRVDSWCVFAPSAEVCEEVDAEAAAAGAVSVGDYTSFDSSQRWFEAAAAAAATTATFRISFCGVSFGCFEVEALAGVVAAGDAQRQEAEDAECGSGECGGWWSPGYCDCEQEEEAEAEVWWWWWRRSVSGCWRPEGLAL